MNLNFHKPMSADYARFVVTNANKKDAASQNKLSKSSKRAPVDLLDSTSTATVGSTASVTDSPQDQDRDQEAVAERKKT